MEGQFLFDASARTAVVRLATDADVEGMARVSVDTWRLTYGGILPDAYLARMRAGAHEAQKRRMLHGPGAIHFVAEEQMTAEPVAFASAGPSRGGPPGVTGEIYELYVQNGFQRQGLGRRLLEAAGAWLAERGHEAMIVWVLADNPNRDFYERIGGHFTNLRTIRVGGVAVDEASYVWRDLRKGA